MAQQLLHTRVPRLSAAAAPRPAPAGRSQTACAAAAPAARTRPCARACASDERGSNTQQVLSVFNVPSKRSAINVLFPGGRDGLQTHLELRETPSEPGADDDSMPRPSSSPGSSANAPGRSAPSRGTSAGLPLEMSSSIMPLRPLTIGDDDVEAMRSAGRCSRRANLKAVRVAGSQSMSCS